VENEETATAEAERARKAEADTRAYARFLADHILAASRPEGLQRGVGHNVTLADALQKAEPRIAEVFRGRKILQALARHQIGVTWQYLGRVGPAEAQLRQAIALREQELGPDDADTLDSRNSLGLLLAYGGRPREAIDELEDVLARHQRAGRGDGRAGLACLNNLAEAYRISGKHTRALELLEPALPKWDTAFGTEHVEWQTLRNNLAMTYLAGGQHSKAVKLQEGVLEQVLEKARARQSPDHALTIRAMNNLATIYEFDGQFKKVLRLREQVWDKMKAAYGADHPETLVVMSSLARAYRRDGKLKLALPLLEESLRLLREKGLANHPGTFVVMCDLAMAHEADGKPSLAEPLYREAAEGMEKLDFQDEHAWRVVHFLSDFYDRSGHLGEAEAWRRKGLAAVEKWFGPDSVQYAGYLAHLGRTLLRQEKWTDAETVLRDSLAIREKKAPIRWWPFDSRSLLGGALLGQKKYAEAEPLLLQGYEGMKEHADANPPPGKLRLTEAVERLVQLFDATGRHDRAAEYRRELEEVKKQKP
jgi:tetratricopeptide (TPR) repeat protein